MCRKVCFVLVMVVLLGSMANAAGPSLKGWWKLDNDATDETGNHDGTENGSITYVPDPCSIRGSHAAKFNGSSWINCGGGTAEMNGDFDTVESITLSVWMKLDSSGWAGNWNPVVCKGDSAWRIQKVSDDTPNPLADLDSATFVQHGIAGRGMEGTTALNDLAWHHVVGVFDHEAMTEYIYIDGVVDACEPGPGKRLDSDEDWVSYDSGHSFADFMPGTNIFDVMIGANAEWMNEKFVGQIDDVRFYTRAMSATEISNLFDGHYATDYGPDPGQTQVSLSTVLSWEAPLVVDTGPTTYEVYFGKNPVVTSNPMIPTALTSYDPPGDLDPNALYYWRVDAYDGATPYTGLETSFRTGGPPVITVQPVDQIVDPCDVAVFYIEAESESTLHYQWYLNGSPIIPSDANSLTLYPDEDDEGDVYCKVSNIHGDADSDTVIFAVQKDMGNWPLAGDTEDDSSFLNHGVLREIGPDDPNWDTEACGTVLYLDGVSELVDCNDVLLTDTGRMTIDFWAKPDKSVTGSSKQLVSKAADSNIEGTVYIDHGDGDILLFNLSPDGTAGNEIAFDSGVAVFTPGKWTYIVCTYDGSVRNIYADGLLVNTAEDGNGPISYAHGSLRFGGDINHVANFAGKLSNVRIRNWVPDGKAVADDYEADCRGSDVCAVPSEYDFNGDCEVTLVDFALLAKEWLYCGLYPSCISWPEE